MDARFNGGAHDDILLSRSTDGGLTWDQPVIADHAPPGVDAFTATVDVDGTGRVAVSYYDFRNDAAGDVVLSTDFWITHSHDGGVTFPEENRLTGSSFDMRDRVQRPRLLRRRLHRPVTFQRPIRLAMGRRQHRQPGQPHGRVQSQRPVTWGHFVKGGRGPAVGVEPDRGDRRPRVGYTGSCSGTGTPNRQRDQGQLARRGVVQGGVRLLCPKSGRR